MQARLTRRLTLEADLLRVVGTEQLTVVYEPIVELETGRRIAAEATVRWQHPQLGEVPRQEFFEIAEESGLIVSVGDWVLRDACRQLVEWRLAAPASAPAFVSVNLSRAEMSLGPRLIDRIRGVLAETRLPAQCLQLEIPQRVATDTRGSVAGVLDNLRACGVRLSMDGFGTGTSSLSCLRSHSFDSVKIAQSSMRDVASNRDALALAHATLTLLENLGMSSVAEGVEDPAQLAVLQSLGCRYAQGRFFSEPVPAGRFLSAWTRPAAVPNGVEGLQLAS
jgi:EAL domain-containing protein (putative c-di-GMP-specific phosphodiesterase class I)